MTRNISKATPPYQEPISRTGVENVKLGACRILFGGHSLGLTKGGVEVEVTTETHIVKLDQFGETTLSERITGRNVMVKVPMAETDIKKLSLVMPGAVLGPVSNSSSEDSLKIYVSQGSDLHAHAQTLELIPIGEGDYKVTVHRANTNGSMSFAFKHDEERVFDLTFNAYPDNSGLMMTLGDVEGVVDNVPPRVEAPNDTVGRVGTSTSLTAKAYDDNASDTEFTFEWTVISQPDPTENVDLANANTATVNFTPKNAGKYVLRVVAKDAVSTSFPDDVVVTVS